MIAKAALTPILVYLLGCGDASFRPAYPVHHDISVTVFWTGEAAGDANGHIPNLAGAWDDLWMQHFGGIDDPDGRDGWRPAGFIPEENPFYAALP